MEGGVPVVDWRMVAAEGELQLIALVEADDAALDFEVKSRRWRRAEAGVGPGDHTQLAEVADPRGQRGAQVQNELSFTESAPGTLLIGRAEVDIAEAGDPQIRRR